MHCSHSQTSCFPVFLRHFLCCPAWHCTHISSIFSTRLYFLDWSNPNPPSCGPTISYNITSSIFSSRQTILPWWRPSDLLCTSLWYHVYQTCPRIRLLMLWWLWANSASNPLLFFPHNIRKESRPRHDTSIFYIHLERLVWSLPVSLGSSSPHTDQVTFVQMNSGAISISSLSWFLAVVVYRRCCTSSAGQNCNTYLSKQSLDSQINHSRPPI